MEPDGHSATDVFTQQTGSILRCDRAAYQLKSLRTGAGLGTTEGCTGTGLRNMQTFLSALLESNSSMEPNGHSATDVFTQQTGSI
jgi:hypothetical protein